MARGKDYNAYIMDNVCCCPSCLAAQPWRYEVKAKRDAEARRRQEMRPVREKPEVRR